MSSASEKDRAIIVLGMHRSGTSAVARGLKALGVELGDCMMPPNAAENPTGYWEDLDVVALNERIFAAVGLFSWQSVRLVPADAWRDPALEALRTEAVSLLRAKFGASRLWGFKDPRTARLVPFWSEVFRRSGTDDRYILVVRNPISVARSLAARNAMPAEMAHLLWIEHMLPAFRGTAGKRRVVVDYDALMSAPSQQLLRIARQLDLEVMPGVRTAIDEFATNFLSKELRHTTFSPEDVAGDPAVIMLARNVFQRLTSLARDETAYDNPELQDDLRSAEEELDLLGPLCRLVDGLVRQEERKIADAKRERESVHQERDGAQRELENVKRELESVQRERDGALRELEASSQTLAEISRSFSWRLTTPLRAAGQAARRLMRVSVWSGLKRSFHTLPVSEHGKFRIKTFLYGNLPALFRSTDSYKHWQAVWSGAGAASIPLRIMAPRRGMKMPADAVFFADVNTPDVSVIIPMCGKVEYTYACLRSLHEHVPRRSMEVIVVEDCIRSGSEAVLGALRGVRFLRNEENLGFLRSCNSAAKAARGRFLLFLNNDTQVLLGWLDELVATFEADPEAGLVGSKLIYPDGTLQEAGGIIWNNGSGWNYGRNGDPDRPEFSFLREVDYCSGASLMVPAGLFREIGGFDERYAPAYYEDVDLAFEVRKRGKKVLYQPLSRVVHFEGVSSGTDVSSGVKAFQKRNHAVFAEKWKDVLPHHGRPGSSIRAAGERGTAKRLLVIDATTPTPDQDAGSVDVLSYLTIFRSLSYGITFIPEDNFLHYGSYTAALQRMGVECLHAPYVTSVRSHLQEQGNRYDLVMLYRAHSAAKHIDDVRALCPRARVLFNTVDLHYLREERHAELERSEQLANSAVATKAVELAVIGKADCTIVLNSAEKDILLEESAVRDKRIMVMPLIIPVPGRSSAFPERKDIVFIGGFNHQPNIDAVRFFVQDIWPLVRPRIPGGRFLVVGSNATPEVLSMQGDGVVVAGHVADLAPLFAGCRLSVAPIRFGAGMKGKVLTSMAHGVPCVATSVAVEGGDYRHDENVLVADSPRDFADAVVRAYGSEDLWDRLSRNGLQFVQQNYSLDAGRKQLLALLDALHALPGNSGGADAGGAMPADPARDAAEGWANGALQVDILRSRKEFIEYKNASPVQRRLLDEKVMASEHRQDKHWTCPGYCGVCGRESSFQMDWGHANGDMPNYREKLLCDQCMLNNRQRFMLHYLQDRVLKHADSGTRIYVYEQTTAFYRQMQKRYGKHTVIGSEYLGHDRKPGETVRGIRHEDALQLSFADGALDLIVSNDVYEHVPDVQKALAEARRVLQPAGKLFFSIPFHSMNERSAMRARLENGQLRNLQPEQYHGNPVSSQGSLVFYDFGWDILDLCREAGFRDAYAIAYYSHRYAYLGGGLQIVFMAER